MKIRSGVVADADRLARVALDAIAGSGYTAEQVAAWSQGFTEDRMKHVLEHDAVIVVEMDNVIAGFASLIDHDETAGNLDLLYVDPKFKRRGVGKRLIRAIEDEALRLDMSALWVDASVPAMHRLLQLGFRPREKNHKMIDSVAFDNTWMMKTFL